MRYKIGIIGSETLLFPFLQFRFHAVSPKNREETYEAAESMIENGYGIIYIEDNYARQISDLIERYADSITPVFVPIGEDERGESYSQSQLDTAIEKAIGKNFLK